MRLTHRANVSGVAAEQEAGGEKGADRLWNAGEGRVAGI